MKRAITWILCILLAVLVVRVVLVYRVGDGAINEFNQLGSTQSSFTTLKLESENNALTKYTASFKALDVLSKAYSGHHFIRNAEYSTQNHSWYLVARDVSFTQVLREIGGVKLQGPTYYVILPDNEANAKVLGVQ